ncbi:hypothetical protein WJX82_007100 [Trebouxia sp. C0006]
MLRLTISVVVYPQNLAPGHVRPQRPACFAIHTIGNLQLLKKRFSCHGRGKYYTRFQLHRLLGSWDDASERQSVIVRHHHINFLLRLLYQFQGRPANLPSLSSKGPPQHFTRTRGQW